jgi:RHS repeat-associated protein
VLHQAVTVVDTLTNPYTRYWIEEHNQFAGMWRDDETGTDHTLHRHYANNLARWLCPDNSQLIFGNWMHRCL